MCLFVKCYVAIKYRPRACDTRRAPGENSGDASMHAFEAKNGDARLPDLRQPSCSLTQTRARAQHREESAETRRWTGEDGESIRTRRGVQYFMCRLGFGEIRQRYRQHKRGE